jgi:hypothetical protein
MWSIVGLVWNVDGTLMFMANCQTGCLCKYVIAEFCFVLFSSFTHVSGVYLALSVNPPVVPSKGDADLCFHSAVLFVTHDTLTPSPR